MLKGTVKWFNTKKGYGFITPDNSENDIFIHITSLEKTGIRRLNDGEKVNFDVYDDRGKKAASNVAIIR